MSTTGKLLTIQTSHHDVTLITSGNVNNLQQLSATVSENHKENPDTCQSNFDQVTWVMSPRFKIKAHNSVKTNFLFKNKIKLVNNIKM